MNGPVTCVDSDAPPSVADFLADASDRLESTARLLSARRWEDIDPVAAVRELSRAVAALNGAVRVLAEDPAAPAGGDPR